MDYYIYIECLVFLRLLTIFLFLLLQLIIVDDLSAAFLLIERIQDLIHSRIALFVVHELDKLLQTDKVLLALGTKNEIRNN